MAQALKGAGSTLKGVGSRDGGWERCVRRVEITNWGGQTFKNENRPLNTSKFA